MEYLLMVGYGIFTMTMFACMVIVLGIAAYVLVSAFKSE